MSFEDGEIFRKVVDSSGSKMLEVVRRPEGVGRFVESTLQNDEYAGDYWSPTHHSGLYFSAEEALADANRVLNWLRAPD